ncbi:MAG TPA: DUF2764 family protein, partial [Victivallales bacterium]|nr:DUF2764 family protein [Victivallales bacterium]
MKNFYYLISSLPALKWEGTPPFTVENFLKIVRPYLSEKDYLRLEKISIVPPSEFYELSPAGKWLDWEISLRKKIFSLRVKSKKTSLENLPMERAYYSEIEKIVQTAMQFENPLEKEKNLDFARWKAIEDFFSLHLFDFYALVSYKLKLEILCKYALIDAKRANENFNKICDDIL